MAQWSMLQQLESRYLEQVDQLYDDTFPMEIRQYLSQWIESHDWESVATSDSLATVRFHDLLAQLDDLYSRFALENNFHLQHNIRKIKRNLQEHFQEFPVHMAMLICNALKEEKKILNMAIKTEENAGSAQNNSMGGKHRELDKKVSKLRKMVQDAEINIKSLEDLQDEHDFKKNTLQSRDQEPNGLKDQEHKREELLIKEMFIRLNMKREQVVHQVAEALKMTDHIQFSLTTEELPEWKRRQQVACIGGPPNTCLDQLQSWFTSVAEAAGAGAEVHIRKRPHRSGGQLIGGTSLLHNSALVLERQPCMPTHQQRPLILKIGVQFTVKLRLLVKLPELNFQLKVKVLFDKCIMGFVSKEREKLLLRDKSPGTFLLRFSESRKDGAITFTWVEHTVSEGPMVHAVEPYTKKELAAISFPDILHHYEVMAASNLPDNPLVFLYPDIPNDNALGRYYSRPPEEERSAKLMDVEGQNSSCRFLPRLLISVIVPLGSSEGSLKALGKAGIREGIGELVG
ncbi:signal transducer and activator of transcription 1-alpha/beta-like [Clupea harengus]|uniref:Signal transducer and activator of transcription 1-alpha/beta-like n=1 Tax=Clupea harengus TaxID=7950 RepID=A0A6P8G0Z5_CLUHA|nr:signal transducer and activator of transcription 1-alpha/beta-like [Clupea harengus]